MKSKKISYVDGVKIIEEFDYNGISLGKHWIELYEGQEFLMHKSPLKKKVNRFRIVEPDFGAYMTIWNIGRHMPDGYLPLVRLGGSSGFDVDTRSMFAMRLPEAQRILAVTTRGIKSVSDAKKYIDEHPDELEMCEKIRNAIKVMMEVKGLN